jgi:hypothetical protein
MNFGSRTPLRKRHLAADLVELLAQGMRRADDDCLNSGIRRNPNERGDTPPLD